MIDGARCLASLLILVVFGFQVLPFSFGEGCSSPATGPTGVENSIAPLNVCDSGPVFAGHNAKYLCLPISTPPSPAVRGKTIGFSSLSHQLPEGFPPSVFRPPRPVRSPIV